MSLLIDVRNFEEYVAGHAEGAIHISLVAILCGNIGVLDGTDKSEHILLYCHSGRRAEHARKLLIVRGFTHVSNLGGLGDVEKK